MSHKSQILSPYHVPSSNSYNFFLLLSWLFYQNKRVHYHVDPWCRPFQHIYIYYKLKQWLYLKIASAQLSQRMWTKFVHHVTKLHQPDKKGKWQQSVFSQHNQRIIQKKISQSLLRRERERESPTSIGKH